MLQGNRKLVFTCKKSLTKLLARLEFGPGTSYNGQSCPDVNKASISRI